jgi:hypothetical protein
MTPTTYRPILSDTVYRHLANAAIAFGDKQYFAAAVWGAVFLEAFLVELAEKLGIPKPPPKEDDLNRRIEELARFRKSPNPTKPDVPDEIVKRCRDVQNTRNRLVHDNGLLKKTLTEDAAFILRGLEVVLDWYLTIRPEEPPPLRPAVVPSAGVPVFLSRANPHSRRQELFLDLFKTRLREAGVEPVELVPTIYDKHDPFGRVRETMRACRAVIVLGLERSHAYFLRDKEGSDKELESTHRWYTSGWMDIEAGMANALGLKVFVLCQRELHSDGIFDRQWNTYTVVELPDLEPDSAQLAGFIEHLRNWAKQQQPG